MAIRCDDCEISGRPARQTAQWSHDRATWSTQNQRKYKDAHRKTMTYVDWGAWWYCYLSIIDIFDDRNHGSKRCVWLLFHECMNDPSLAYIWYTIWAGLWIYAVIRVIVDSRWHQVGYRVTYALIVCILTPVIWLMIYWLFKTPIHTVTHQLILRCKKCHQSNQPDHEICIFCGEQLTKTCKQCKSEYLHSSYFCYKCGAPNI